MLCFSKGDTYFNSTSNFIIDTDKDFIMNILGNCKMESDGWIYIPFFSETIKSNIFR